MRFVLGRTGYPLRIEELEPHEEVRFGGYLVAAFPVEHRGPAYGYAFVEDDRPGRFDAAAARALGVQEGPDFGRLQRGEEVGGVKPEQVVGPERPGRRIVLSGDTRPCQTTEVYAHGADVLVHEATFLEDERARARETGHSTAAQAAEIARDAGVRLLALTHLSTRYFPRDVRDEARATFPDTVVPRDFDAIDIPFPERGEPALVKAGARALRHLLERQPRLGRASGIDAGVERRAPARVGCAARRSCPRGGHNVESRPMRAGRSTLSAGLRPAALPSRC